MARRTVSWPRVASWAGLAAIHAIEGLAVGAFVWSLGRLAGPGWSFRFPIPVALIGSAVVLAVFSAILIRGRVLGFGEPAGQAARNVVLAHLPLLLLALQLVAPTEGYQGAYAGQLIARGLLILSGSGWGLLIATLFSRRGWPLGRPRMRPVVKPEALVQSGLAIAMVVTALYLGYQIQTGLLRHHLLEDMSRPVWIAGTGDLRMANNDPPYVTTIFWAHAYPMYLLLGPLMRWMGGAIGSLLGLQVLLVVLGAIPVYRIATRVLGTAWAGVVWALVYLWYPPLHMALFRYGFYVDLMSMPFLLWALEALLAGRTTATWAWLVGFMLWKESSMPLVITLGLYVALALRRRALGFSMAAAGAAWLGLGMWLARVSNGGIFYNALYEQAVLEWVRSPAAFLQWAVTPKVLAVLGLLILPFGGLALGSSWLLVSLPMFWIAMIHPASRYPWMPYFGLLLPGFLVAAITASRRLITVAGARMAPATARTLILGLPLAATIGSYALLGPFSYYRGMADPRLARISERDVAIDAVLRSIPPDASVAASPWLRPSLGPRRWFSEWPAATSREEFERYGLRYATPATRDAEYVIVDLDDPSGYLRGGAKHPAVQTLLQDRAYGLTAYQDRLLVFQRGASGTLQDHILDHHEGTESLQIFDGTLALLVCRLDRRTLVPGGRLRITYIWRCLQTPRVGYAVWARLVRDGDTLTAALHEPVDGLWPSTEWRRGDTIRDTMEMQVPVDIVPTTAAVRLEIRVVRLTEPGWLRAGQPLGTIPRW